MRRVDVTGPLLLVTFIYGNQRASVDDSPPRRRVSVLHLHMLGSTAPPVKIPDCRGDSYGYQGLTASYCKPTVWSGAKLFHNLWINYQLRGEMVSPPSKGELCGR